MSDTLHPFDQLMQLAAACRQQAAGLPAQEVVSETWSGVGFRLAGQHLVAAMGEVSEILHEPRYTALPRVKSWVRGVANVRGRLLPIIDLSRFFAASNTVPRKQRRVLVLDRDDVFAGLLVDEVLGMQHFPVNQFSTLVPAEAGVLAPFVVGSYASETGNAMVFNFRALAHDQAFLDVAI
ncbi:chemotaxis protein CheW [Halopseudomonas salegens]|uniref:Twitching motility protein PilI n=1 Tax=Halopseudomonas salegens TaxID=1434072 RepID=A0A1H2HA90_9GAMM|nr:chemotaxis protein CheW [Halopseudomonas salegens]SDU28780.1 twitching motility protein PilI [Halopseudomonas salegens]